MPLPSLHQPQRPFTQSAQLVAALHSSGAGHWSVVFTGSSPASRHSCPARWHVLSVTHQLQLPSSTHGSQSLRSLHSPWGGDAGHWSGVMIGSSPWAEQEAVGPDALSVLRHTLLVGHQPQLRRLAQLSQSRLWPQASRAGGELGGGALPCGGDMGGIKGSPLGGRGGDMAGGGLGLRPV